MLCLAPPCCLPYGLPPTSPPGRAPRHEHSAERSSSEHGAGSAGRCGRLSGRPPPRHSHPALPIAWPAAEAASSGLGLVPTE